MSLAVLGATYAKQRPQAFSLSKHKHAGKCVAVPSAVGALSMWYTMAPFSTVAALIRIHHFAHTVMLIGPPVPCIDQLVMIIRTSSDEGLHTLSLRESTACWNATLQIASYEAWQRELDSKRHILNTPEGTSRQDTRPQQTQICWGKRGGHAAFNKKQGRNISESIPPKMLPSSVTVCLHSYPAEPPPLHLDSPRWLVTVTLALPRDSVAMALVSNIAQMTTLKRAMSMRNMNKDLGNVLTSPFTPCIC
jgi:hypothetical protein